LHRNFDLALLNLEIFQEICFLTHQHVQIYRSYYLIDLPKRTILD
jgi:hypothetical protein